jgi:glycosyltransferase involved in cell wall biosynthesis
MNIVLATGIYPPEIGGPATFTRGLAQYLTTQGHTVSVVTYGDEQTEAANSSFPVRVVTRKFGPLVRYIRYAWEVFCLARKAEAVFAQGPVSEGLPAAVAALCARKPLFLKVVGDYAWESASRGRVEESLDAFVTHQHSGKIAIFEWIERYVARRAKRIFVPSVYLRSIVSQWGIPQEKIQVIYNRVHLPVCTESREELRKRFGLGADERVILFVGRLVPWKHVETLIQLMPQQAATQLVVIGDGPMRESLEALASSLGLSARVRFLGKQPNDLVFRWHMAADVFVLPSSYEGLPHVGIEAIAAGTPVIVSDAGGNPELQQLFGPERVTVVKGHESSDWSVAIQHQLMQPRSLVACPLDILGEMERQYETELRKLV